MSSEILQDKRALFYKNSIKINYAFMFVIALFLINDTVRSAIYYKFGWGNLLFVLFSIPFVIRKIFIKGNFRPVMLYVTFSFSLFLLLGMLLWHRGVTYGFMTISNLLLPLLLLCIKIDKEDAIQALRTLLRILNVVMIIVLLLGVIDYLTHGAIQLLLARTLFSSFDLGTLIVTEHNYGIYRYYSILGHPLTTAKYFLIFFIMNNIYAKHDKYLINNYLVTLITLLGLILSGSKTALVLGLVLFIFFNAKKNNKWLYIFILAIVMVIFLQSSLFQDNLKQRFIQGAQEGDLTSGRNTLLELLIEKDGELPKLLVGGGSDYSREVAENLNGNIHNFEYPAIMLAYDYGIVGMLLIYFCLFLYPMAQFLIQKRFYVFFIFLILAIMLNTNNGLASLGSDTLSSFCFLIFILMNLPREKAREKDTKKKVRKRIGLTW
ncbi:hypothetical protein P4672_27455 [Priestia megaterium]|uniref:hypothetical protein n=1 Tax=Priestia megaterium TaxID=1404 RepID=UPI002E20F550|nr:hypothetical protein [Priestia megaterium]